jgi:hypothetical protein
MAEVTLRIAARADLNVGIQATRQPLVLVATSAQRGAPGAQARIRINRIRINRTSFILGRGCGQDGPGLEVGDEPPADLYFEASNDHDRLPLIKDASFTPRTAHQGWDWTRETERSFGFAQQRDST